MSEDVARAEQISLQDYLLNLTMHGIKLGLDNIEALLHAAGNPHQAFPSIHIAGTNGKGSVAAFIDAMFRAAGYHVGRFTSPHLIHLRERFQISGAGISDAALAEGIGFFKTAAEALPHPPTFFEMNTAIAFRHFAREQVDVAVVEVGMGGRLDATNVLQPLACAITNIGLEHTQYLGETRAAIAGEKAGILKQGVPTVAGEQDAEALDVIQARARVLDAPLHVLGRDFTFTLRGESPWSQRLDFDGGGLTLRGAQLGLPGSFQGENAAVALMLATLLQPHFPRLDGMAIQAGLAAACWPCRLERVLEDPPVIIDVAHNPAGVVRLLEAPGRFNIVFAVSSDKPAREMLALLAPRAERLILTTFSGKRTLPLPELEEAARGLSYTTAPTLAEAIEEGMAAATHASPLLITGSIYTAGEARELLSTRYGAPPLRF